MSHAAALGTARASHPSASRKKPSPGRQIAQSFQGEVRASVATQYLLFLPLGYHSGQARRWPLILFLHGSGERGRAVRKVAAHGPPKLVGSRPDFPCIVVSPQCANGAYWSNSPLLALLEHVLREHAVDPRRVYLTGLSMGGYGVWNLALAHPELFAAAVPICGGGDILPLLLADRSRLRAFKALPVWAFHGADDPVVPVNESDRMVATLRQIGNQAKLTIYPGCGHDSWTQTYNNPDLFDWLLAQQLPAAPAWPTRSQLKQQ